jgi:hypothetical protein
MDTVFWKSLKLQGMILGRLGAKYWDDFYRLIPPLIKEGKIQYTEHVVRSLDDAAQLIVDVQKGNNVGKVSALSLIVLGPSCSLQNAGGNCPRRRLIKCGGGLLQI